MVVRLLLLVLLVVSSCTVRVAGAESLASASAVAMVDVEPLELEAVAQIEIGHVLCKALELDATMALPPTQRAPSSAAAGRVFRPPRAAFC